MSLQAGVRVLSRAVKNTKQPRLQTGTAPFSSNRELRVFTGTPSRQQQEVIEQSREALDKYDKQLQEARHYEKYLARLTLNARLQGLYKGRQQQAFIQDNIKQMLNRPRFRDWTTDENYNPLFGTNRQARLWRPNWFFKRFPITGPDPLYWRRPVFRGPFRDPRDINKDAYDRYIPKIIRRPQPPPLREDRNTTTPNPYYAFPWEISSKKKLRRRKAHRKSGQRYYTRKKVRFYRRNSSGHNFGRF